MVKSQVFYREGVAWVYNLFDLRTYENFDGWQNSGDMSGSYNSDLEELVHNANCIYG